jgi:hypothetical protein
MMPGDMVNILAPIIFRAAEKFFKFVSWALLITVIKFANERTGSTSLWYLYSLATTVFAVAIFSQAYYLVTRDPADWKIPPHLRTLSYVLQFIAGTLIIFILASPNLILDDMVANLAKATTKP